jgi:Tfp pilus assembly protein PilN
VRAVNLLPRDAAGHGGLINQGNLPVLVGTGLGVLVTAVLAVTFLHAAGQVRSAQARLTDVDRRLAETPKPPPPVATPNAQLAGEQSARLGAVSNALGARLAWDRILREFSLVLPDDVWLASLTLSTPDPANPGAAGFAITGYTYSHDAVARLLSRLSLVPDLITPTLAGTTAQTTPGSTGGGTVQFNISAGIQPAPGATAVVAPPPPPAPTDTSTDSSTDSSS